MTTVRAATPGELRVILCLKFKSGAPFTEVAELKRSLIEREQIVHSVEVSGSYDFMAEAECGDLAAYQALLDDFAAGFGHLVKRYEASFICRRYIRESDHPSNYLWVPNGSGMQRLEHRLIDKVAADGDYVKIHSGTATWLLHATMKKLVDQLDSARFLQINRSLIVRIDFIDRLAHDYRRWTVRLLDGTEYSVAKSRSSHVVSAIRVDSSNGTAESPAAGPTNEISALVTEKLMH